jgi:rRNA-processing protein FCF1
MAQVSTKPVFVQGKNNSKSETVVLLDTNVLLTCGDVQEFSRVFAKMGVRIAVTRNILRELRKKSEDLYSYASTNFEVVNDYAEDIVAEARFIYTHSPDNSLIAAAKVRKLLLISRDQVMLRVAAYHGVDACFPEQLVQSKHFIDRVQGGI